MFDSVGRNLDEGAAKRQAASAAIAFAISGLVSGAVVLAGLWTVREVVLEQFDDEEIVEVAIEDDALVPDEAPPPPPPPPPPASSAQDEEEEDDVEEEPDPEEMLDEVQELKEEIKEEPVKSVDKPKGVEGGVEGGQEGGVVGGVLGGVEGGVVGGVLGGGGPRVVHHSQVEVKRRIDPRYPPAARGMGLGEQRCVATVEIDVDGMPVKVKIDKCPKVFHPSTEEALLKWRWYPYKLDGQKVEISTKIAVVYKET